MFSTCNHWSQVSLPPVGVTIDWPGSGTHTAREFFRRTITRVWRRPLSFHSLHRHSANLALKPAISWVSSRSSLKGSTRTTLTGCSLPSPIGQTSLTNSATSPLPTETADSSRCSHHSETILVPKIRYHLHSSTQPRSVTSVDYRSDPIPTSSASKKLSKQVQTRSVRSRLP